MRGCLAVLAHSCETILGRKPDNKTGPDQKQGHLNKPPLALQHPGPCQPLLSRSSISLPAALQPKPQQKAH